GCGWPYGGAKSGLPRSICDHGPDRRRPSELLGECARSARRPRVRGGGGGGGRGERDERGARTSTGRSLARCPAARTGRLCGLPAAHIPRGASGGHPRLQPRQLGLRSVGGGERRSRLRGQGRADGRLDHEVAAIVNRRWLIVVPIAVVLLTSDLVSGFTSLHSGGPEYFAVLTALGGAGFVLAGLLAWRRPLGQAIGQVLVLVGLLWLLFGALWAANDPLLYTVGEGFGSIPIASLLYLVLVYPVGRPTTPLERILAYVLFPTALLANFLPVLFQGRFGNDCPGCSRNRFL